MDFALLINFVVAMLAIVNPVSKVPVWLEMAGDEDAPVRWRLALLVCATSAGVLILFAVGGRHILELFHVDLAAFRVAGGILIFMLAVQMIRGEMRGGIPSREKSADGPLSEAKLRFREILTPMVVPILVGPGSITTVVVYASRGRDWGDVAAMTAVILVVFAAIAVSLIYGGAVHRLLGDLGLEVMTRLLGLILAGIAMQFVLEGLGEVFPRWLGPQSPVHPDSTRAAAALVAAAITIRPGRTRCSGTSGSTRTRRAGSSDPPRTSPRGPAPGAGRPGRAGR